MDKDNSRSVVRFEYQTLKLGLEDSQAFAIALLNPPAPNQALKAAALRYKQLMKG